MKKLHSGLAAAVLAAGLVAPEAFQVGQANAAPIFVPKTVTAQSDVIKVGHRRYRNWYPAGAFVAGALIGGAIANNRYYGGYYRPNYYNSYYGSGYYPRAGISLQARLSGWLPRWGGRSLLRRHHLHTALAGRGQVLTAAATEH
jgi:hypothetical protein